MRLIRKLWVLGVLGAWLSGTAFAQCHASTDAVNTVAGNVPASIGSTAGQGGEEDRTVLLELVLRKSGAVRDVRVIKGPMNLRTMAIKAVKTQENYKKQLVVNVWPGGGQLTVEVKFPQGKAAPPEIRQVLPAGVPACLPAPRVVRVSPEVMQSRLLNRVEPVYPAEMPEVQGMLILQVRIGKDGSIYNALKISGPDVLVAAAVEAVKKWKYQPYLLNGEPTEVETTVDLKFPD